MIHIDKRRIHLHCNDDGVYCLSSLSSSIIFSSTIAISTEYTMEKKVKRTVKIKKSAWSSEIDTHSCGVIKMCTKPTIEINNAMS